MYNLLNDSLQMVGIFASTIEFTKLVQGKQA